MENCSRGLEKARSPKRLGRVPLARVLGGARRSRPRIGPAPAPRPGLTGAGEASPRSALSSNDLAPVGSSASQPGHRQEPEPDALENRITPRTNPSPTSAKLKSLWQGLSPLPPQESP
ncbi:uncharacterized protein LOC129399399 [Sorex araneus]|uniref:uncharacterized protein LOC129399399 n=1 Tax=Sorex araneus TaxID=42254 RepID=UPI002433B9B0|nr:uncharacterized protein LOC129399399 [Sorex araneus]